MAWLPTDLRQKLEWAAESLASITERVKVTGGTNERLLNALEMAKERSALLQRKAVRILRRPYK